MRGCRLPQVLPSLGVLKRERTSGAGAFVNFLTPCQAAMTPAAPFSLARLRLGVVPPTG